MANAGVIVSTQSLAIYKPFLDITALQSDLCEGWDTTIGLENKLSQIEAQATQSSLLRRITKRHPNGLRLIASHAGLFLA